jgi:hypothetical protein
MSRTRKRPYRGSRRFDITCRCHGSCPWCRGNRTIQTQRAMAAVKAQLREVAA